MLTLTSTIPLAAQISPGALSRAHRSLSGAIHCTSCHELSIGKATFKCVDCHGEIAARLAAHRGLHASYGIEIGSSGRCIACHSEHNGEDFQLIKWDIKKFDHKRTGYALEGKHAGLACSQCHSARHIAAAEIPSIKVQDLNKTFLGVSTACITCHQDPHKGRLGSNCLQCHNFTNWKDLGIGKFDHSVTRYPLTGLHAQVACRECHTPGPDKKPRYVGIAFGKCTDCHEDPHRGGFAQGCESCHNTAGWKQMSASARDDSVDHAHTRFPLLGKHAQVGCVQCHAGGDFKKPLAFRTCADCHKDAHGGQFAKRADRGECASCHTVDGFKPSTFGLTQHAAAAYPLEGKHAALECGKCHIPRGKDTAYDLKFQHCTDCHKDPHAGQFAGAPHLGRCEDCHTVQKFQPSTFTLARHKDTRFALTGGHVATACNDCHKPSGGPKSKAVVYHWPLLACTSCHVDPHKGQFAKLMLPTGSRAKITGCEVCHSTQSWNEFSAFDHARTSFPLVGAHKTTACAACHKPERPGVRLAEVNFQAAPSKCETCHQDVHGGQFSKKGPALCADCHNSEHWKPSLFDHNTRTTFPLEGAHRVARCESCHKLQREVRGKSVLFYKPTPRQCEACHGANAPKKIATLSGWAMYERVVLRTHVRKRNDAENTEGVSCPVSA